MPLNNKVGKRYLPKPMALRYAVSNNEEHYGTVNKALGNCHFQVDTINGESKNASLCGVIKKRGKIKSGDLVLIEPLSEDTDKKYQIIFKYTPQQKKILEKEGHLKSVILENEEQSNNMDDDMFAFEGEVQDEENTQVELDENFIDGI